MTLLLLLLLTACEDKEETPVRATLGDGQVLLGEVRTRTLLLEGGAGTLAIPLEDVGEVRPVEGDAIGDANGHVVVWLRNGSELRGRWNEPELAMGITVGGAQVEVDLPMNELERFQLQGGEDWPEGPVFRMRTTWGDDFLVDPAETRLVLENELGTFAPFLSECRYAAPVDAADGDWRIELVTGTVLVGKLRDDAIEVALPMGPDTVTVPLDQFVSLQIQDWGVAPAVAAAPEEADEPLQWGAAEPAPSPARARPDTGGSGGWFDNQRLEATKQMQQ